MQQGDSRLKKESADTNASDALTKPLDEKRHAELVDNDGLRVQRRAHSIGAGSTMTIDIVSAIWCFTAVWCFQQQDFFEASGVAQ